MTRPHMLRRCLSVLAAALLLGLAAEPATAESTQPKNEVLPGEPAGDEVLSAEIKARLHDLENIRTGQVSARVTEGVVILEGAVSTEADKLAAERAIKAIEGVKMVINSLEVI